MLTSDDIAEDPTWMTTTPIVVTNNLERLAIIKEQVIRFGQIHGKPVIAWLGISHYIILPYEAYRDSNRFGLTIPKI